MTQFLAQYGQAISIVISVLMLMVWIFYLQLLFVQFRAARRSSILITRAGGRGMRSRCLVTNMSSQPLYVTSLIGIMQTGESRIELPLTDLRELPDDLGADPRSRMGQGSLNTGQYLDIGHFDEIIATMLRAHQELDVELSDVQQLDLIVVAFYAPEHLPVGARRTFMFNWADKAGGRVQPASIRTEQIRNRRRRRELLRKVEYHM